MYTKTVLEILSWHLTMPDISALLTTNTLCTALEYCLWLENASLAMLALYEQYQGDDTALAHTVADLRFARYYTAWVMEKLGE